MLGPLLAQDLSHGGGDLFGRWFAQVQERLLAHRNPVAATPVVRLDYPPAPLFEHVYHRGVAFERTLILDARNTVELAIPVVDFGGSRWRSQVLEALDRSHDGCTKLQVRGGAFQHRKGRTSLPRAVSESPMRGHDIRLPTTVDSSEAPALERI